MVDQTSLNSFGEPSRDVEDEAFGLGLLISPQAAPSTRWKIAYSKILFEWYRDLLHESLFIVPWIRNESIS